MYIVLRNGEALLIETARGVVDVDVDELGYPVAVVKVKDKVI